MNNDYLYRFSGISRLYGVKKFQKLQQLNIAIVGIGGVGSWSAEALARSGVNNITLIDMDDVCLSNTNRQLHALDGNIGKMKVKAIKERILKINPYCKVNAIEDFFTSSTQSIISDGNFDGVIDAIDSLNNKCQLISLCKEHQIPLIVTGGAGGKQDPTLIEVKDLAKTIHDKLLLRVRKKLTKDHNFPKGKNRKFHIPTVYSTEFAKYPDKDGEVCETPSGENLKLDCSSGFGTASFVTGTFGFMAAAKIIELALSVED